MAKFLTNPALKRPIPGEPEYDPKAPPWVLLTDLHYQSDLLGGEIIIVPAGFRSDLASVPWVARRWFPQDGPWTHAAIVHDALCDWRPPYADARKAADIFHEAMEALKVPAVQREAMYHAVRWFGPRWDS